MCKLSSAPRKLGHSFLYVNFLPWQFEFNFVVFQTSMTARTLLRCQLEYIKRTGNNSASFELSTCPFFALEQNCSTKTVPLKVNDAGILRKNPYASNRSPKYVLLITSSQALPLSYRRLVGVRLVNSLQLTTVLRNAWS